MAVTVHGESHHSSVVTAEPAQAESRNLKRRSTRKTALSSLIMSDEISDEDKASHARACCAHS